MKIQGTFSPGQELLQCSQGMSGCYSVSNGVILEHPGICSW